MAVDHSLQPDLLLSSRAAEPSSCGCGDSACDIEQLAGELDEKTISYVLATRPHFDDLRQSISQVAGMLVLATAGSKSVNQEHPMLVTARGAYRRALDGLQAARPTKRAEHHHRHLLDATQSLGLAIARSSEALHAAADDAHRREGMFGPLKAAYRNLNWAARVLPGFEILSFDQACCAPQRVDRQ